MSDVFTEISEQGIEIDPAILAQLSVVAKGDLPGHEFHGNQYTDTTTGRTYKPAKIKGEFLKKPEDLFERGEKEPTAAFMYPDGRIKVMNNGSFHQEAIQDKIHTTDEALQSYCADRGLIRLRAGAKGITIHDPGKFTDAQKGTFRRMFYNGGADKHLNVLNEGGLVSETWEAVIHKGGAGSGNYGHAGRPGEVGGSGPGMAGGFPTRENYLDPNKPVPRRFTEGWFRPRLQERIAARERGEGAKLLIDEGVTRPTIPAGMTAAEAQAEWERFRAASTAFRDEGNVTEWARHYNYGRYYLRYAQQVSGTSPAEGVSGTAAVSGGLTGKFEDEIDLNKKGSFDDLRRDGHIADYVNTYNRAAGERWDSVVPVSMGTFFNNIYDGLTVDGKAVNWEITSLEVSSTEKSVGYAVILKTPDGEQIGTMTRRLYFDEKRTYNSYMKLEPAFTGKGINKQIFRKAFLFSEHFGFTKVECGANIDVGGYAWSAYGYHPDQYSWASIRRSARSNIISNSRISASRKDALIKILEDSNPKAMWAFSDTPEGKHYLLGKSWSAEMTINDPETRARFMSYTAGKGKK